jgi:hypothetical protein
MSRGAACAPCRNLMIMESEDCTSQRLRVGGLVLILQPCLHPCGAVQWRLPMKWPQATFGKGFLAAPVFPDITIHFPVLAIPIWTTSHQSPSDPHLPFLHKRRSHHRHGHCRQHCGGSLGDSREIVGNARIM